MPNYSPLSQWIKGRDELPRYLDANKIKPCYERGGFLSIDIVMPIHKVVNFPAQSLSQAWNQTREYFENAMEITRREDDC